MYLRLDEEWNGKLPKVKHIPTIKGKLVYRLISGKELMP